MTPVCTNTKCNPGKFEFPKLARFGNTELAYWYCEICRSRYDKELNEIKFECIDCLTEKSIGEFGEYSRNLCGHRTTCKDCRNKADRENNAFKKMQDKLDKIKIIADEAELPEPIVRLIIDRYNE